MISYKESKESIQHKVKHMMKFSWDVRVQIPDILSTEHE